MNIHFCHTCPHGADSGKRYGTLSLPCLADGRKRPFVEIAKSGDCPIGKFIFDGTLRQSANVENLPFDQWPLFARLLAKGRGPGDVGLGDTIARIIGDTGERFKRVYKRLTGSDCGCANRQAKLNERFKYG